MKTKEKNIDETKFVSNLGLKNNNRLLKKKISKSNCNADARHDAELASSKKKEKKIGKEMDSLNSGCRTTTTKVKSVNLDKGNMRKVVPTSNEIESKEAGKKKKSEKVTANEVSVDNDLQDFMKTLDFGAFYDEKGNFKGDTFVGEMEDFERVEEMEDFESDNNRETKKVSSKKSDNSPSMKIQKTNIKKGNVKALARKADSSILDNNSLKKKNSGVSAETLQDGIIEKKRKIRPDEVLKVTNKSGKFKNAEFSLKSNIQNFAKDENRKTQKVSCKNDSLQISKSEKSNNDPSLKNHIKNPKKGNVNTTPVGKVNSDMKSTTSILENNSLKKKNIGITKKEKKQNVICKDLSKVTILNKIENVSIIKTNSSNVGFNSKFNLARLSQNLANLSSSKSDNKKSKKSILSKSALELKQRQYILDTERLPLTTGEYAKKIKLETQIESNSDIVKPVRKESQAEILKKKLKEQLQAGAFRYVNEQLYTQSSSEAQEMFQKDRGTFNIYHQGYMKQIEQWPLHPLKLIRKWFITRPKTWVVADFGCGDARLAASIPQRCVKSLDLVAVSPKVIACDMANTPLQSDSVDVAVFCLSLMGTNLNQFILEANRVLKIQGIMKIAEVESRFNKNLEFVKSVEGIGFRCSYKDTKNKYFWLLDFVKEKTFNSHKKQLPLVELKPCLYKKR